MRHILIIIIVLFSIGCKHNKRESKHEEEVISKPNIIIIYADDLGYGDLGCYGAKGVETPNIDRLAKKGIRFTDAHSTAATCTPSRYSLLTGSYAFRNKAQVLAGDAPLLIAQGKQTLPGMLRKAGFKTGVVGKWHLGLGDGNINWNEAIEPGPKEVGFDYSFLIPATGDRVPAVFVENQKVVNLNPNNPIKVSYIEDLGVLPTGKNAPELLKQKADLHHSGTIINGISRIGSMSGGKEAWWVDEELPNVLVHKAKSFIVQNKTRSFFLYLSYHDIHVPRVPNNRFAGKSAMGVRGDAIAQMDWCTGEIIKHLEKLGLDKNTLVLFSSDNGPVLNDGYEDEAVEKLGDHKPGGPFNGGKYSVLEAGTRMPTIAYWPSVIQSGVSEALWSQVDIYASLAKIVNYQLTDTEALDSWDMSEVILGKSREGRELLLEESFVLALRKNNWKYIPPLKGRFPNWVYEKGINPGVSGNPQLYDLSKDIGEKNNLAEQYPERVQELKLLLSEIRTNNGTRKFSETN
ncbi:arylsulfatase [Aureibaculum sp. 2210JD6-5]|uniref:sulfatase family protein n=1 Tax=Aureibaculum sp. 2210JD6-5 TaxID=3103957 RepID=UPI002AAE8EAC|nr:arylsulfatase [Aureibaculum sp. 2210JD6-5]MDY7396322.1 arylsulfatase [Aureibaculum sp. 2210JD6-5]